MANLSAINNVTFSTWKSLLIRIFEYIIFKKFNKVFFKRAFKWSRKPSSGFFSFLFIQLTLRIYDPAQCNPLSKLPYSGKWWSDDYMWLWNSVTGFLQNKIKSGFLWIFLDILVSYSFKRGPSLLKISLRTFPKWR